LDSRGRLSPHCLIDSRTLDSRVPYEHRSPVLIREISGPILNFHSKVAANQEVTPVSTVDECMLRA